MRQCLRLHPDVLYAADTWSALPLHPSYRAQRAKNEILHAVQQLALACQAAGRNAYVHLEALGLPPEGAQACRRVLDHVQRVALHRAGRAWCGGLPVFNHEINDVEEECQYGGSPHQGAFMDAAAVGNYEVMEMLLREDKNTAVPPGALRRLLRRPDVPRPLLRRVLRRAVRDYECEESDSES